MKVILSTILVIVIGLITGFFGWVFAAFLVDVLFTGTSKETASIFSWGIYLCCVIIVCTGVIIKRIDKR